MSPCLRRQRDTVEHALQQQLELESRVKSCQYCDNIYMLLINLLICIARMCFDVPWGNLRSDTLLLISDGHLVFSPHLGNGRQNI